MSNKTIVIATTKSWNISNFSSWVSPRGFKKHLVICPEKLTWSYLRRINPRYVFFLHWSWMIPKEIYENFECVVFHSANLPFGRGGSPIQNHIIRGIYNIKVCALRAVGEVDAGPVYLRKPISIKTGSAEEIFKKISKITFEVMEEIVKLQPVPKMQHGKGAIWKRRKPKESLIPTLINGRKLYDFIRMLDAEGYPKAFIDWKGWRYEFSNAVLRKGNVIANVNVKKLKGIKNEKRKK